MKLLRRHSSKGSSQVEILLHIEDLGPWPAQHGTLAVQFLRGKRSGQTRPQNPDDESTSIASYTFDETLTVPATLYRSSFGENGGYEEKKLSIFIAQVDEKGKELSVLGGVELNLADFADIQGKESRRQSYPIECSSAIWKPAGGRPKLTMSVAVARGGDKAAAELKAELSAPLSPVDEIPSTLSTDVEDESLTASPEAQGSVGGETSGEIGINNRTREATSNIALFGGVLGTTTTAAAAALATSAATAVVGNLKSENLVYDSDGFLVDSELSESRPSPSGGTVTNASPLSSKNNNIATAAAGAAGGMTGLQNEQSADSGTVVKRNLNKDLAEANNSTTRYQDNDSISPLRTSSAAGGGGVASAASGTVIKKGLTPGVDQTSSPGSIDQPQHPVHTRRFSRGDGAALGSRKWAWRRQSNDPVGGDGGGDGDVSIDTVAQEDANSPVSATEMPFTGRISGRSTSAGASAYVAGTSGLAGTTAAAGAVIVDSKAKYGTPDTAVGISPSILAGSLGSPSLTASFHRELQISAALESAIFLAGRGWSTSTTTRQPKVEQLQAPARRLARTIIILGPEEGAAFGHRAVSAIRAAAAASLNDPQRLLLWWANAVTLRWSFWALGRGGDDTSVSPISTPGGKGEGSLASGGVGGTASSHFDWLSRSLGPALRHLEAQMYSDLINYLWNGVLVPTAVQSATDAAAQKDKSGENMHLASTAESKPAMLRTVSNGNSSNSRTTGTNAASSTAEGAMDHWIRALRAVDAALTPAGRPPAAPRPLLSLLRRQVMTGMLTRLDGVLIDILLFDTISTNSTVGNKSTTEVESIIMKPELVPISRCPPHSGAVTTSFDFISGVELKMAAGRLVEYAASEIGIRDGAAVHASSYTSTTMHSSSTAGGSGIIHHIRIASRIKEVADLLMTPKSSLGDQEVRKTVAPSLPPAVLVQVLQKYHPDDADVSADDKLPLELLKQLRVEASTSSRADRNTINGNLVYSPPLEEVLLEEGLIQPLSLETSAHSDDELSVLEERGDVRYTLLRELWGAVG